MDSKHKRFCFFQNTKCRYILSTFGKFQNLQSTLDFSPCFLGSPQLLFQSPLLFLLKIFSWDILFSPDFLHFWHAYPSNHSFQLFWIPDTNFQIIPWPCPWMFCSILKSVLTHSQSCPLAMPHPSSRGKPASRLLT